MSIPPIDEPPPGSRTDEDVHLPPVDLRPFDQPDVDAYEQSQPVTDDAEDDDVVGWDERRDDDTSD